MVLIGYAAAVIASSKANNTYAFLNQCVIRMAVSEAVKNIWVVVTRKRELIYKREFVIFSDSRVRESGGNLHQFFKERTKLLKRVVVVV